MSQSQASEKLLHADACEDQAAVLRYSADVVLRPGHLASEECSRQVREASNGLLRLAEILRTEAAQSLAPSDREAAAQTNAAFADVNLTWPGGTLPSPFQRGDVA